MMEGPNVLAYLFPVADPEDVHSYQYALHTVKRSENSLRYVPEQREVNIELGTLSRESTVSLDEHIEDSTPKYLFQPGLQLTFNPGPRAGPGYVLGTDKNSCDIVLPKLPRISRRLFNQIKTSGPKSGHLGTLVLICHRGHSALRALLQQQVDAMLDTTLRGRRLSYKRSSRGTSHPRASSARKSWRTTWRSCSRPGPLEPSCSSST
jgi:hypothetical protein